MSFVKSMQFLHTWANTEAQTMSKEEILDKLRVKVTELMIHFVSYPHISNFSLMQEDQAGTGTASLTT